MDGFHDIQVKLEKAIEKDENEKMDGFHDIQVKLEKAIEKDENEKQPEAPPTTDPGKKKVIKPDPTLRERLGEIIHSQKFQVLVICLVVLDCLLVIAELLIDLDVVRLEDKETHVAPKVFHYLSLAVLSLFMVEIGVRVFVMRLEFLRHKLEVFDAVVVVVSFILDLVFRDQEGSASGVGLLVVLRLWRVTRIINGIVMSVKAQAQRKIEHEVKLRTESEQKLTTVQQENTELRARIDRLVTLLQQNDVPITEDS